MIDSANTLLPKVTNLLDPSTTTKPTFCKVLFWSDQIALAVPSKVVVPMPDQTPLAPLVKSPATFTNVSALLSVPLSVVRSPSTSKLLPKVQVAFPVVVPSVKLLKLETNAPVLSIVSVELVAVITTVESVRVVVALLSQEPLK